MLTAQYERLGLQPKDTVLDLGCGFGRHAFEAARRLRPERPDVLVTLGHALHT